ncbi:MAG: TIGR01777 family oxidoreductase [Flavipsychrobacter sp.]|nr:TIGR01777 family oxidoreductase [Flavipsychrobacter sp.]
MIANKIVLAGGNGYLGSVLAEYYSPRCVEVVLLSRRPALPRGNIRTVVWDALREGPWVQELEHADMLINLCGKNVNCRYNEKNRSEIVSSRVVPTTLLGRAIAACAAPPALWINVTSATIYRHAEDRPQDEETGEIGSGFSIDVCNRWEEAFYAAPTPATRKVALRMGIVLGRRDGVFPRLRNMVRFGLGGKQGNGRQYVSWIHEHDVARITEWLLQHPELQGHINCVAPSAVTNAELMRHLRQACKMPIGLPAPAWLLEIGALLIGTETELILKSRWVTPKRLLGSGFKFRFEKLEDAVRDVVG